MEDKNRTKEILEILVDVIFILIFDFLIFFILFFLFSLFWVGFRGDKNSELLFIIYREMGTGEGVRGSEAWSETVI